MHKIDQLKELFNCNLCREILVKPITFPCGNTVCEKHFHELKNSENLIECTLCQKNHIVPEDGFTVNKIIQHGLEIELSELKLNPIFGNCKKALEETKESAASVENLKTNPDGHIKEYFNLIKQKVKFRKGYLKRAIDIYASEVEKKIEIAESNCLELSKVANDLWNEIDKSTKQLSELTKEFESFEFNDKKFEDIKHDAEILKKKFDQVFKEYKESLVEKNYQFVCKEVKIEEVVGYFCIFDKIPKRVSYFLALVLSNL
jgi:hypothetical protein